MIKNKKIEILHRHFSSEKNLRKQIVDTIIEAIGSVNITINIKDEELYLTIDEAVTNAMEHGNLWSPDKEIGINVFHDSHSLTIRITDQGPGFDTATARLKAPLEDRFSRRGRGLYIINQFCEMTWNKKGNQVELRFAASPLS